MIIKAYKESLFKFIQQNTCSHILEIGVYQAELAIKMLTLAHETYPEIPLYYTGIDLFESLPEDEFKHENSLIPLSKSQALNKLQSLCPFANIQLFSGYSHEVLPKIIDIIRRSNCVLIDGGHSIETIRNDWNIVSSEISVNCHIFLDDYYHNRNDIGAKPIIETINDKLWNIEISLPKEYDTECGLLQVSMVEVYQKKC